jgi:lysophospholipase L1-like esterase
MEDQRISYEALNTRLTDISIPEKELSQYFRLNQERSVPFQPVLELNPDTVILPDDKDEFRRRSDAAMTFANDIAKMRRRLRFEKMMGSDYHGPVIVSEGDSWFQYPLLLEDTIDHLYLRGFAIRSLGAAGDTLEEMLTKREYLGAIAETGASLFLLSAGGNDALGGGNLRAHLRDFDPALSPAAHLLPSFSAMLDRTMAMYERLLREIEAMAGVYTLCHGYDYAIPQQGKWLGEPMRSRGITDPAMQREIVKRMIDDFNDRLHLTASRFDSRVIYVNARGAVGANQNDWHDELHPKDAGYGQVAERFAEAIVRCHESAGRTRSMGLKKPKTTTAERLTPTVSRKGWSLHLGLNTIDPNHYGSDGELFACHYDAEDMARIARDQGFARVDLLLDQEATREKVIATISAAAETLRPGDFFLFTYAGHGSQVPDFNRDEADRADETLCLFDGMLIDDELYRLWSTFADDVRIVMISDSCHSGTVLRTARRSPSPQSSRADEGPRSRLLPMDIAARTFRAHREFYTELGRTALGVDTGFLIRELDMPLRAQVLLISGCQDNQVSQDGVSNGRFTQELLLVLDQGRFQGNWRELHRQIVAGMPASQTPNLMLIGRNPERLANSQPFSI